MTIWNNNFEASPADTDKRRYGARKIREIKTAVSEREELEHNFKNNTKPFHKAGCCSVLFYGATVDIPVTGIADGCIAFDTTLNRFKRYNGTSWEVLTLSHDGLANLIEPADDHLRYLNLLVREGQTLENDLLLDTGKKIDGVDIASDYTDMTIPLSSPITSLTFSGKTIKGDIGAFSSFSVRDVIFTSIESNKGPFCIDKINSDGSIITTFEDTSDIASVNGVVFKARRGLDEWSSSLAFDTNYHEIYDCFITVCCTIVTGDFTTISAYSGPTEGSMTLIQQQLCQYRYTEPSAGLTFPIPAGYWWKVLITTDGTYTASIRRGVFRP